MDSALTSQDVCAILEACRKSGVSSLTFSGLHVEFSFAAALRAETPVSPLVSVDHGGETPLTETEGPHQQAAVDFTPEEKQVLEDARLSQLMTDDPLAYEQEVIDAKLEGLTRAEGQESS